MGVPLQAGGENLTIAQSKFLYQSADRFSPELVAAAKNSQDATKMNMCQAVLNSLDLALSNDDKAGMII